MLAAREGMECQHGKERAGAHYQRDISCCCMFQGSILRKEIGAASKHSYQYHTEFITKTVCKYLPMMESKKKQIGNEKAYDKYLQGRQTTINKYLSGNESGAPYGYCEKSYKMILHTDIKKSPDLTYP